MVVAEKMIEQNWDWACQAKLTMESNALKQKLPVRDDAEPEELVIREKLEMQI